MVNWLLPAVAATAIFGLVVIGDKFILSRYFSDPLAYSWLLGVVSGLLGILMMITWGNWALRLSAVELAGVLASAVLLSLICTR